MVICSEFYIVHYYRFTSIIGFFRNVKLTNKIRVDSGKFDKNNYRNDYVNECGR